MPDFLWIIFVIAHGKEEAVHTLYKTLKKYYLLRKYKTICGSDVHKQLAMRGFLIVCMILWLLRQLFIRLYRNQLFFFFF